MTHTWNELESASLGGDRSLQQWLGGNERGAFFRTTSQSLEPRALVKLIPEELADADTQLALWRRTRHLSHPNLLPLLEYGRTNMAGEGYLYAVFEHPDDRLETAIGQGPLGESEVREVLGAVIGALRYLHAQGLMHGALDADHVVAVGNSTKLTTDSLQELGDRGHAEDVRALGALVYELLTGKKLAQGEEPDFSEIAEPFCTIIQRAAEPDLRYRWTLAEIVFALKNSAQDAPVQCAPVQAAPEPALLQVSLSPVPDTAEAVPATQRTRPIERTRPRMPALLPRWIYFGVGALLLLIV